MNIGSDGNHRRMSSGLQALSKTDRSRPANRSYPQRLTNTDAQFGGVLFMDWKFKWTT